MKNSYKLAGAAFLVTIGVGITLPSVTKAETSPDVVGKGKIKFIKDTSVDTSVYPPGETTGELTEPTVNPHASSLKIRAVTDLDFATQEIVSNDSNKTYSAKAFTTTQKDGSTEVKMSHFVDFQDVRQDADTNYHTVSAKMTKQFTAPATLNTNARTLTGATITYNNTKLVTGTNNATKPVNPILESSGFTLTEGVTQDVYINKEADKGYGQFQLVFGEAGLLTEEQAAAYNNVELYIPGSTIIKTGEYQAEITWSIADVPIEGIVETPKA